MIWDTKKGYKATFEEAVSPFATPLFFDGTTTVFNVGESSEWCVGAVGVPLTRPHGRPSLLVTYDSLLSGENHAIAPGPTGAADTGQHPQ